MLCPSIVSMLTECIHGSPKKALWHLPMLQVYERFNFFKKFVKLENELAEVNDIIRNLDLSKTRPEVRQDITGFIKRFGKATTKMKIMNCLLTSIKR